MKSEVRKNVAPPGRVVYHFERLAKRGNSIFFPGGNPHNIRQASISYQKYHPEIAKAGDKFHTFKETSKSGDKGVAVYRLAIDE